MKNLETIVQNINLNKKIKIRLNSTTNNFGVFLDYTKNKVRERVFLNILISKSPKPTKQDMEQLYRAELIRDKKEIELFSNEAGFILQNKTSQADFIKYFEQAAEKKMLTSYHGSIKQLGLFLKQMKLPKTLPFRNIDNTFCVNFRDFLVDAVANPTAKTYLAVFKTTLNQAKTEGLIPDNPCNNIAIKLEEHKRGFLNEEELSKFINSETTDIEVKNAFIFSAQTSLRLGDIRALKFSDINNGFIYFKQQKTKGLLNIKISHLAQQIVEEQKAMNPNSEFVFELQKSRTCINNKLNKMAKSVGITKDVHFHMVRHTFATLALTKGVDIYTVSKYMGHNSVSTTEIYSNLVDHKINEVAEKINVDGKILD
jgi:integrase